VRTVRAARYVTPLREGGSVPAIVEGDDEGLYVTKFRGAAQGIGALLAELLGGALAQALGFNVPERVLMDFDGALARNEADPELRELLKASAGLNMALDYLPGSVTFDPLAGSPPSAELASDLVLFDAFITNVDRTVRNPNLLTWHRALWLIDHGSAFYFHHDWENFLEKSQSRFPQVRDHVLLPFAGTLERSAAKLQRALTEEVIQAAVSVLPEGWLGNRPFQDPEEHRQAYARYLVDRRGAFPMILEEAQRAHARYV
jgi:hypothetical protein